MLLQRGRLALNDIERFLRVPAGTVAAGSSSSSHLSTPPPTRPQILHTLIVLVQHNILYHIRLDDGAVVRDHDEPGGTEYFVINTDVILARTRFGTFMETAQSQWGQEGLDIVSLVLQHGKIKVADLLQQLPSTSSSTRPLITHLLLSSYLVPSTLLAHLSPHDLRIAYDLEALKNFRGIPAAKDQRELDQSVKLRIVEERAKDASTGCVPRTTKHSGELKASAASSSSSRKKKSSSSSSASAATTKKRKKNLALENPSDDDESDGDSGKKANGNKRVKAVNGSGSGAPDARPAWMDNLSDSQQSRLDEWIADEDIFVRLNYDRFDVHIRNELLRILVHQQYNAATARVYMAILEAADARYVDESSSSEEGVISAPSVSHARSQDVSLTRLSATMKLPPSVLASGFDTSVFTQMASRGESSKPSKHDYLLEYAALLCRADNTLATSSRRGEAGPTSYLVAGTTSGGKITSVTGSDVPPSVSVDYASAGRKLKWHLLRSTVARTLGETEARVLGVLRRDGKLEEKHISKLALCALGETREACARLFGQGIVSLQEIPKSADRNPQRTFFLYFLDYPRALAWLGDHLAKTQARLAQRRNVERNREKVLLSKIERTDVRDEGLENVLSEVEKERLAVCREKLVVLTAQEMRVQREGWILARMRG